MIRPMHIDEIGGARARQTFNSGGRMVRRGEEIPLDALRSWPTNNRNVMIEKGYIEVWPRNVSFIRSEADAAAAADLDEDDEKERIVVPRGFGKFMVVEGVILADGVAKEEADVIAGTPHAALSGSRSGKPVHRKDNPRSRSYATAPEPKMPLGIKPADEPNGPVEE
jgi:hypothetical protein